MRTIGGQFREIAATEAALLALLRDAKHIDSAATEHSFQASSVADWQRILAALRAETLAYIETRTEEDLARQVAIPMEWFESLGLDTVPLGEPLRSLAAHEWYHVGQLVSYLWLRGDDPYEW